MDEIRKVMGELKALAGTSGEANEARKAELTDWLVAHKAGHETEIDAFLESWLVDMESDNEDIKQQALRCQMDDKLYKLIPWSFIAKEYFGKSVAWLTQRINGYTVRGKVYTLNDEQKATLNKALADIGKYIGSYRIA